MFDSSLRAEIFAVPSTIPMASLVKDLPDRVSAPRGDVKTGMFWMDNVTIPFPSNLDGLTRQP